MLDRVNQDVAFGRVEDLQRETENSRQLAAGGASTARRAFRALARWRRAVAGTLFEPDPRARVGDRVDASSEVS